MSEDTAVVVASLGIIALVFGGSCLKSPLAGGDIPIGYPHSITGVVEGEPSTRYVRSGDNGQEKASIIIGGISSVPTILNPGLSGGSLYVECASTRCLSVHDGERHEFACRAHGRFFEPNVVSCKHVRAIR